jgi:NADH:ubiquinone oxidoreductase subunit E
MSKSIEIEICMGSSCFSRGNSESLEIIEGLSRSNEIPCDILLKGCLCKESCASGPIITVNGDKHKEVDASCVKDLLLKYME